MNEFLKELEAKATRLETLMNAPERSEAEGNEVASLSKEMKALRAKVEAQGELDAVKGLLGAPGDKHVFENKGHDPESVRLGAGATNELSAKSLSLTPEMFATIGTNTYKSAFMDYVSKGEHRMSADSMKVIREGADSAGGFLVPAEMLNQIISKKPAATTFLGKVRRLTTSRDSLNIPALVWPTDDIRYSSVDATATGEIPSSSTAAQITDPTWANVRIQIFTYMMSGQLSKDILEDNAFDVEAEISRQMADAYRLKMMQKLTIGTGIGEPIGIVAAPDTTIAGQLQIDSYALGSPFTAAKINMLPWFIPDQYDDAELSWMFRKQTTGRIIRGLVDGNSRPIWSNGAADYGLSGLPAVPAQLAGYPFMFNAYMPDAVNSSDAYQANTFPLVFGDFTGFAAIERIGFSLQVLNETKAKDNQIELVGRGRFGGQTIEPWKLRAGKVA